MKTIEQDFAVDSSGFGTSQTRTWFSQKHGREIRQRDWRKVHAMCGVRTHIVTAVVVTPPHANDAPFLPELARTTAKSFELREVSADKGYLTKPNAAVIEDLGAVPFIPFKSNRVEPKEGWAWARRYHLYAYERETFLRHDHKRSNVKTVFAMVKAKFGDSLSARSDEGQTNEVLAKIVAPNLCVLVQSFYELGIESKFRGRGGRSSQPLASCAMATITKWEYRIVVITRVKSRHGEEFQVSGAPSAKYPNDLAALNDLGEKGWELVSETSLTGVASQSAFYFKRPLP